MANGNGNVLVWPLLNGKKTRIEVLIGSRNQIERKLWRTHAKRCAKPSFPLDNGSVFARQFRERSGGKYMATEDRSALYEATIYSQRKIAAILPIGEFGQDR